MKNVDEFVEKVVKIEFIEDFGCAGHYPFQLFVEKEDESFEMDALLFEGDVTSCYNLFAKHKNEGARRIYMSLDFPKGGEIESDYVVVFIFENGGINLFAIPYSDDCEMLDRIEDSPRLTKSKQDFEKYL